MRFQRSLACTAMLLVGAHTASGQDAAKFFDDNCAMCHAIGGPPGGALDLKDVTKRRDRAWLVRFILNPEQMAKTDTDAIALVEQNDGVVMPAVEGATPAVVEGLLRYINRVSERSPARAPVTPLRSVTAIDIATGLDLYVGRRTLTRRGPSCASCHRLESVGGFGGGTLGPDLTGVRRRLGGTRGLAAWLGNPPTRVMRAVFRDQPLANEETFVIAAMLGEVGARQPAAAQSGTRAFVATGLAGALMTLVTMAIVWSRRLRAVRRPLVEAARDVPGGER